MNEDTWELLFIMQPLSMLRSVILIKKYSKIIFGRCKTEHGNTQSLPENWQVTFHYIIYYIYYIISYSNNVATNTLGYWQKTKEIMLLC